MPKEKLPELRCERLQLVLLHHRKRAVVVRPLEEERMRPFLGCVRLETPVEAHGLSGRTEQCDERGRDGAQKEQTVPARWVADACGREAHPEADVLHVPEALLDCESRCGE